jgi:hypothetical protein
VDGLQLGGWALRGDRSTFDVGPMVESFGQVYRYPVEPGPRASAMAPGQPCVLILEDTSRVVGLWFIGEVVAPVLEVAADADDPEAGTVLHAEVEMLPLAKPISLDKLRGNVDLAASELFTAAGSPNPLVLEPRAMRAIESFEFEIVAPTAEQSDRLDAVLAAEETAGG